MLWLCMKSGSHRAESKDVTEVMHALSLHLFLLTSSSKKGCHSWKEPQYMSTLKGQLELLMLFKQRLTVVYVYEEKSSVFWSDGKKIGFVDSHMHVFRDQIGGAVHIYAEEDLDAFIHSVAESNSLSPTTYGNLTFLKF